MYVVSGLGVTCGAHRLWTHRSYKATLPLQVLLLFMFSCASQTSVRLWARNHRLHHKHSDTHADPHNIHRGLFYAHIGWLMMKKHPEALAKGKTIDISDIENDPLLRFHERNILWINGLCCFILPTLAGVWLWDESWWTAVAWQCFIRYASAFHCEFTVNSLAHAYGYRPYNSTIPPAESWYVSLTTLGEGYHNYHHSFPFDYKAAETWDLLNLSTAFIRLFRSIGWAYDLKEASEESVRGLVERLGKSAVS
nr:acyl-CoA Delta(11) desaturase-like [Helicoverpa armigera]